MQAWTGADSGRFCLRRFAVVRAGLLGKIALPGLSWRNDLYQIDHFSDASRGARHMDRRIGFGLCHQPHQKGRSGFRDHFQVQRTELAIIQRTALDLGGNEGIVTTIRKRTDRSFLPCKGRGTAA